MKLLRILVGGIVAIGLFLGILLASIIGFGAWGLEKLIDRLEPEK